MDDWLEKDYSNTVARLHEENKAKDEKNKLLEERVKELEEENLTLWCKNNGLEKALKIANIGKEVKESDFAGTPTTVEMDPKQFGLKHYAVYFYHPSAQQSQMYKTWAKNEFRAGRNFYRFYNWNYRDCIEAIYEI